MRKWMIVLLTIFIVIAGIILALLVGATLIRRSFKVPSVPVVDINTPSYGDEFLTGKPIMVQAVAHDPDGVNRVEFWLDKELIKSEDTPWKAGINPLPLAHSLRFDQTGEHVLVVRAFDTLGNYGQSSMLISVLQGPDPAEPQAYEVQEGDSLAGIAESLAVPEEEIIAANPGMTDSLPPAGTEITLPTPAPESEEGEETPEGGFETSIDYAPEYLPPAMDPLPWWLYSIHDYFEPVSIPAGFFNMTLLEADAEYDEVFCYVSAGDSPVIRIPADGFLTHLSENYWDIAEWFSGDRMLPFFSSSGSLRLRMNCVGYYYSSAGGVAYNLGTLDITRTLSEYGEGLIDERTPGASNWFRVQFTVQPLGDGYGGGGTEFDYLYLDSSRYARDEVPLVPDPHVLLEFRIMDEGRHITPPVMDGFLIYRNGSLWRTTGPNTERYVVWDHLLEAGGCGQQTEFFVVGYMGNPLAPSATITSQTILVSGYCPYETQFKMVTVQFNWLNIYCLDGMEYGGLITRGGTGVCSIEGYTDCEPEDFLAPGCPSALDNFGPVSYGGLNVNGHRVIEMAGVVQFTPRSYSFVLPPWEVYNHYSIALRPDESLTIATDLWDYDVWSADDPICPETIRYSPEDLALIIASGGTKIHRFMTTNLASDCAMEYKFTVEPFYPPAPVVVP